MTRTEVCLTSVAHKCETARPRGHRLVKNVG